MTDQPQERMLSLSDVMSYLDRAMERVGLDENRAKMLRQIFLYGEPVMPISLTPLPDVEAMQRALETVQTWFHARPSGSPRLDGDVLMHMQFAGYPIEGGIQ